MAWIHKSKRMSISEHFPILINSWTLAIGKKKNPSSFLQGQLYSKTVLSAKELVRKYTDAGDEVLVITISSEISGTWQALKILFRDNKKVTVFDSRLAVGGIRFLVEEARRYDYEPVQVIVDRLKRLVSRIVIAAIPETLDYLLAGGRLSKTGWMFGTVLAIKPVIGFVGGKVAVTAKKRGKRQAMRYLAECVKEGCCDPAYGIIA